MVNYLSFFWGGDVILLHQIFFPHCFIVTGPRLYFYDHNFVN